MSETIDTNDNSVVVNLTPQQEFSVQRHAVLSKGEIGFSASSDDQWRQALETLYGDSQLQLRLGANGRQVIEQFYNADKIAADLAGIFRSLV